MSKRLRFSITFKTTTTYTLIFSVILFVLCTGLMCAFGLFLLHESNNSLERNSLVISNFIKHNAGIPGGEIKEFADVEGISVEILDQNDKLLYSTGKENQKNIFNLGRTRLSPTTSIDEYLHYETPVKLKNGTGTVKVAKNLAEEGFYLAASIAASIVFIFLAIIATIIIGSKTSRRMLSPIDNMTRTARSISSGDLTTRLDVVDSHDELKELAETFNEMLDRIQASFEQQNVFVSDASHELRTPIAVIQGYANLLQRWGKEDKAVLEESITAIKSESDYMKELVEKLLFLASTDKKAQKIETNPFSLDELIDEVAKESRLIDAEHTISSECNQCITLNGDRGLIKQALRVFIDNSIKYTPAGGVIKIDCSFKDNKAVIIVEDNGIGIAEEDLPFIFNRFYKCDKARSRDMGGAGLGLSISKWIIEKHKGAIKFESTKDKGTKVIITLPASGTN
ncbi:MAG: ATP-binding protein [Syntrophomonas sp.]|nr:ATP-binding protein [Syntrophomonas sp.]